MATIEKRAAERGILWRLAPAAALIAVLALILGATRLLAGDYLQRIVIIIGINLILVVSLNLSNGFTGVFSLGHVGFMAIGAYSAAILTLPSHLKALNLPDLPIWLRSSVLPFLPATLIGGMIAMLVAFVVGLSLMRLNGSYISVATLGFLVIVQVILVNWDQVTRGARTFAGVPEYTTIWNVWIWAALSVYLVWRIGASAFGRDMRAARDNEIAALSLGTSVLRSRLLAFCMSAFLTGVAGSLWAHFITSFSPKSFFFTQAFSIITMLVIGGLGSVSGSVIGVVLVTVLSELLRNAERGFDLGQVHLPPIYGASQVLMSILFVLVIVFKPAGIMGGREMDLRGILRRVAGLRRRKEAD
ncbi:MAG: branched-chain amino acid ABC transporter permease [Rectinemataceae bacterium]|jgi:branched-chain amino acid transport system permease protein